MVISAPTKSYDSSDQVKNLLILVEDNIDHAELLIRIIEEHPIPNQVVHFHDGQSALDFLFRRNSFSNLASSPRPKVILLDIQLPGVDGIDILRVIKSSEELRMIPVVMLTTSSSEMDIRRAYSNHANDYLVKPVGCEALRELIDNLCIYWLSNNRCLRT